MFATRTLVTGLTLVIGASTLAIAPASADNVGNSCNTATPIANGQTIRATIDPEPGSAVDTDNYAYTVPVGTRYWITVDLTELARNYDLYSDRDGDGVPGGSSTNEGTSPERLQGLVEGGSAPYCFFVRNRSNEYDRNAPYAVSISYKVVPPDNGGDSSNLAGPLTPGVVISETLEDTNDKDWYTFSLGTQSDITVDLVNGVSNGDIRLYDNGIYHIAESANSGTSPDRIAKRLDPGTYWVQVFGDGDLWTPYQLSLAVTPVPTRAPAPSLSVRKTKKSYVISWSPVPGASAYEVKRGRQSWIATNTTWTSVSKRAAKRGAYVVKVRAVNEAGKGTSAKKVL